jgi:predicted NAD/FAD-binding protein
VGGAKHYVEKIVAGLPDARLNTPVLCIERDAAGVTVHTHQGQERFDHLVLATHSDQALSLLKEPTVAESEVLGAIRYQPNRAVLHTDASVLPQRRAAWAAWNYERAADGQQESSRVCLHYWLNKLQPMPFEQAIVESLNPVREIADEHVLAEFEYSHPVFDLAAIQAQKRLPELQGVQRTWYCGAWTGYGFHEDGLKSGLSAAKNLLTQFWPGHKAAA